MATNTQGQAARELPIQAVHYMRKTVTYSDSGISTGIGFNQWLPAGARILATTVIIETVFNAQTTNVLTVGTNSSSYNDIVASADVDETTLAGTTVLTGCKLAMATDLQPFVKYTQTGTAATTGKASIHIQYSVNNDG
jgi:hypothetical protein